MTGKFEAFLFALFFTFWCVRLYYKLYDKKIRKYILSIGVLIVFWMFVRMSKGIVCNVTMERYIWYLYYVALIFTPALFYICSKYILGKLTKKQKYLIYGISSILLLLVLTNDLHELVFIFNNTLSDYDNYKHNIGYYLISGWIFYLFGGAMISLAKDRIKVRKNLKAYLPLIVLLVGFIYNVLYVLNVSIIRDINMSVFNSALICVGLELMFYLGLIPNNSKYIKAFENSHLSILISSYDGKIIYKTKYNVHANDFLKDISKGKIKEHYKYGDIHCDIIKNKDGYVFLERTLTELNKIRNEVAKNKKELLKQKDILIKEEKNKKELTEITTRTETINKIENKLNEKRIEAEKLLNGNINKDTLSKIKKIIIYSKKKSMLIISEINNEIFSSESIKVICEELFKSMNEAGLLIVKDKININANTMNKIYDILYELISNDDDLAIMAYFYKDKGLKLKIIINKKIDIKNKNIKAKIKTYDNDTEYIFNVGEL